MRTIFFIFALFAFSIAAASQDGFEAGNAQTDGTKRIAISFDDAPRSEGDYFFRPEQRTINLVKALRKADIRQAAFFIRADFLVDESDFHRVDTYADAGHAIANHSYGHKRLGEISAAAFLADLDKAERELAPFANRRSWFRFPYLDEGKSASLHETVLAGLKERGLANGYATVDSFDWYLDRLTAQASGRGACINREALEELFVEMVVERASLEDRLARVSYGRSPAHVLLLHETDLAATFLPAVIDGLREAGWTIVSADEAYRDPIASLKPRTLLNNFGKVAAIAHALGAEEENLRAARDWEDRINADFERRVLNNCEEG